MVEALKTHLNGMSEVVALGVGTGIELNNFQVVTEALNRAKKDKDLDHIFVFDEQGNTYASYNPHNTKVKSIKSIFEKKIYEEGNLIQVVSPISFNQHKYGTLVFGYSLNSLNETIYQNKKATLIVSLTIFALGTIFTLLISRKITTPLSQLTFAANEISKGNTDVAIDVTSKDEVGELSKAFKVMIEQINSSMEKIKATNFELEVARDNAIKSNRFKSEFLSRMSHELRTPMNAILGFGQLLSMDSKKNLTPSQKKQTKEILMAGQHLLELINEILDLSKIESGKLQILIEEVNLTDVIEETVDIISPLIQQNEIDLQINIDRSKNVIVLADRIRLKQVILNLLSNAIKYNHKKGWCVIACNESSPDRLQIQIKNSGDGIPKEKMDILFQPFERLGFESSEIEGTGIGLSITKNLIELMNSRISVESIPGQETCFTFDLPVGKPKQRHVKTQPAVLKKKALPDATDEQFKILYVEDNQVNLELVKQILSSKYSNIEILSAPEARLGIEMAKFHLPNLILMDISLPGMSGIEALKSLKEMEATQKIPVVAVSANAMDSDVNLGMKEGFDAYITKPIQVDSFLNSIQKYMIAAKEKSLTLIDFLE